MNAMANQKAKDRQTDGAQGATGSLKSERVRRFDDLKELFVQTNHGAKDMIVVSTTITITT